MRKLKRSVARAAMEGRGVQHMNKKHFAKDKDHMTSFFALHWRKFV